MLCPSVPALRRHPQSRKRLETTCSGSQTPESIRALRVARRGAVKARTQAGNQLRDLIVTAPEQVRDKLAGLTTAQRVALAARFRPGDLTGPAEGAKAAMAVRRRWPRLVPAMSARR